MNKTKSRALDMAKSRQGARLIQVRLTDENNKKLDELQTKTGLGIKDLINKLIAESAI